jgi:hypothetical protein
MRNLLRYWFGHTSVPRPSHFCAPVGESDGRCAPSGGCVRTRGDMRRATRNAHDAHGAPVRFLSRRETLRRRRRHCSRPPAPPRTGSCAQRASTCPSQAWRTLAPAREVPCAGTSRSCGPQGARMRRGGSARSRVLGERARAASGSGAAGAGCGGAGWVERLRESESESESESEGER